MTQTRVPKILIISSDTGGGHRSAAAAIAAGVQKFFAGDSYAVRVVRAVEESHHLSEKMVRLYNWVLRHRQPWMKYVYWFVNRFRPEARGYLYRRSLDYVRELFERWCPHVVGVAREKLLHPGHDGGRRRAVAAPRVGRDD